MARLILNRAEIVLRHAAVRIVEIEEIGEAVEFAPPERKDVEIGARRAHALEAEIIGAGVERAEAVEPHHAAGAWRIEMGELRDQPRRLRIIVRIFARETAED